MPLVGRHTLAAIALSCATLARAVFAQHAAHGADPEAGTVDRSDRIGRATVIVLAGATVRERGVVIADDGRIVTALRPLNGQTSFTVRFPNGHTSGADVVASDPAWGIAILQPRAGTWGQGLPLADNARGSMPVRWAVGNEPLTLGGHLGHRHTFVGPGAQLLRDAWQIDPSPGDRAIGSGVADASAEIVAVIVPPDPSVQSGGSPVPFGVPADVVHDLIARAGNTARPWLGLVARAPRPNDTQAIAVNGLRVTDVSANGPAAHAGVIAGPTGDVIIGTPDRPIRSLDDLGAVLAPLHPGDTLTLRVFRQGITFDLPIQLGTQPAI